MSGSRIAPRRAPAALVASLVAALVAGALPVPASGAASPAVAPEGRRDPAAARQQAGAAPQQARADADAAGTGADAAAPDQRPSIAYEEAMAHEGDEITFEPGGLVTTGFTPRAADRWPVGGMAPRSLPGGRATGREMAASTQGSQWAELGPRHRPGRDDGAPPADEPLDPDANEPAATPEASPSADQGPAPDPNATPDPDPTPEPTPAPIDAPGGDDVLAASIAGVVQPSEAPVEVSAASGLRRQVFGFLPYWELSGASTKLNYDVLSTIAYFSVGATGKGNLKKRDADGSLTTGWGGWTSSSMTSVINAAHQRGTRVVLTVSVFAWTSAQADVQRALLGSATARSNLAKQAAAAVRDRGADGVNLDFEPLASGYADEFVLFLKAMRTELNRVKAGYQLTYDTTGYIGNYPLEASVGSSAADAIFVMGYDYRTSGSGTAGSIDPLSGPKYDLTDTVRAYTARVSPSRVILGLPWYGRAWSTTSSSVRASTQSGTKFGTSTAVNYESLTGLVAKYGRKWDSVEQSPYLVYQRENCTGTYGCVTSWRQVYYDDGASLKLRLAMVNDYGLRGSGMWALGYDGGHSELYRAYTESFLVDKSAPQAGVTMLAGAQGDEGFVVTWSARDTSAVASYDVQVSTAGGGWAAWLTGTRATSDVWLGRDGTGYAFRVRARDAKGNAGSWNVTSVYDASPSIAVGGFGRVTTDGLAYRTGPGTDAAKLGTLDAGTIVAITRGPVGADGYTWYEVTQPIRQWGPVAFVERGVWIAVGSSTVTHVVAYRAPNSTRVDAGVAGLDFGSGASLVGTAAAASRSLSPNGDGSRDAIPLRWTNTLALDSLALRVFTTGGSLLGSVAVPALAAGARSWDWNGRVGGARVADGRYVLQLVGVAGGKTYSAPSARPVTAAQIAAYAVTVDTEAPVVTSASATGSLLSPNGDGYRDSLRFALATTGAVRWTVSVTAASGTAVRTLAGAGGTIGWTWNGANNAGSRVADGRYAVSLATWDNAGNRALRTFAATVDTTAPSISPRAAGPIFSPNGDGAADSTQLSWSSNEALTGTARIYRGTTLIRSWSVSAATSWSATWKGRTAAGTAVPDGTYSLKVAGKDAAGNKRTASTKVVVDRTAGFLGWSRSFFPQDGDGLRPTSLLSWRLTRQATTSLAVYDAAGTLVRRAWTDRTQAAGARSWTWDGKRGDGTFVPQGRYVARLTVASPFGTQTLGQAVWATGFLVTPSATSVKPGQTLTVTVAAVEPIAAAPKVTFAQPGKAAVTKSATRLADGRYRASFTVATGTAGSGTIKVTAKDTSGGTNSTTVTIRVRAS